MRRIATRTAAVLTFVLFAVGLTAGAAQAQPRQVNIGPVTVCSVVTFFDIVIFEYDCDTEG